MNRHPYPDAEGVHAYRPCDGIHTARRERDREPTREESAIVTGGESRADIMRRLDEAHDVAGLPLASFFRHVRRTTESMPPSRSEPELVQKFAPSPNETNEAALAKATEGVDLAKLEAAWHAF